MESFNLLMNLLSAYQKRDPAATNKWEVLFLYPGIKAIFFHRIASFFHRNKMPFIPRMISEFSRWLSGIEIHPGAVIGKEVVFDHGMGIVIGETAIIKDRVLIYHGVTLGGTELSRTKRHPTIEDEVVLGAGAKILGNITIGQRTRIGANSVVITDIPAGSTAVGIPAKVLTKDSPDFKQWNLEYYL